MVKMCTDRVYRFRIVGISDATVFKQESRRQMPILRVGRDSRSNLHTSRRIL